MLDKKFKEVATQMNYVLENMDRKLLHKIPNSFIEFFNKEKSTVYIFEYDKTKTLDEQNLHPETRGIIALMYEFYLCNEEEKETFLHKYIEVMKQKEEKR